MSEKQDPVQGNADMRQAFAKSFPRGGKQSGIVALPAHPPVPSGVSVGGADSTFPPIPGTTLPVTLSSDGWLIAAGSQVQLIFWGNAWNDGTTTPSKAQLTTDVQSILAGPWRAGLSQYGVPYFAFGGATVVTDPPPPATYNTDVVEAFILDDVIDMVYPSEELNLYFVMMPPGTSYGPGGLVGNHWAVFDDSLPPSQPPFQLLAFIINNPENIMTSAFCHELAELVTDPEGSGWQVNPRNSGPGGTWNEIGDICNFIGGTLAGVTVQSYWSQKDNACLIPRAPSVRTTLQLAGITLASKGLRSLEDPIPSLNTLIDQLYGRYLASGV